MASLEATERLGRVSFRGGGCDTTARESGEFLPAQPGGAAQPVPVGSPASAGFLGARAGTAPGSLPVARVSQPPPMYAGGRTQEHRSPAQRICRRRAAGWML